MKTTKFKPSEVGPIPVEWEVVRLGQMIEDRRAQLQTGPFGTVLSASEFVDAGHPVISVREIRTGYIELFDETPCVNDETYKELKKYTLRANDLVFARKGSVDRSALVPNDGIGYFLGSDGICVRFDDETVVPKYVLGYFQSETARKYLVSQSYGTTMAGLNEGIMRNLQIVLPPRSEQEKIAEALSDVDALLTSLTTLIEKKRAIKQGAMQQLLTGKKRLAGFNGKWVEKRLGDCGYCYNGITGKSANDFGHGEARYITFLNVLSNVVIRPELLEEVDIDDCEKQNKVRKGDLFFNTSSETPEEVGYCAVLNDETHSVYLNSFCFGFRLTDTTVDGKFMAYWFRSAGGRDLMTFLAQGSTRYNLSKESFRLASVLIPSTLAEQHAIAAVLSDMDAEIAALETKRAKCESIKQGMMQELLTGKIRLEVK